MSILQHPSGWIAKYYGERKGWDPFHWFDNDAAVSICGSKQLSVKERYIQRSNRGGGKVPSPMCELCKRMLGGQGKK